MRLSNKIIYIIIGELIATILFGLICLGQYTTLPNDVMFSLHSVTQIGFPFIFYESGINDKLFIFGLLGNLFIIIATGFGLGLLINFISKKNKRKQ